MKRPEDALQRRWRLLGPAYRLFYDRPVHAVRAEGVWLFDEKGERYLDAYNNVPHVGHCHPRVVDAMCAQARMLNTHTRYLSDIVLDYAEALLEKFPDALDTVMFACTGTEANELALRIARAGTGGSGLIAVENAYHGNSWLTTRISAPERETRATPDDIALAPCPDTFRGRYRGADAGERYAKSWEEAIELLRARGHQPAAFIVDTVLASNGLPRTPPGWLAKAAQTVRAAGGLLVADEVQAGFGRLGAHFWGFEKAGVTPDIVTLGKPMGNGQPIAAVVTSRSLIDRFARGDHYFNTFGGNPVSCAAANAVLDVMEEERLQANALAVGDYLKEGLEALAGRHAAIGDVRGQGLFLAVDLIGDRQRRDPASATASRVVNAMRDRGVLIGVAGPHENVLKIRPPLVFRNIHADLLLERLDEALP